MPSIDPGSPSGRAPIPEEPSPPNTSTPQPTGSIAGHSMTRGALDFRVSGGAFQELQRRTLASRSLKTFTSGQHTFKAGWSQLGSALGGVLHGLGSSIAHLVYQSHSGGAEIRAARARLRESEGWDASLEKAAMSLAANIAGEEVPGTRDTRAQDTYIITNQSHNQTPIDALKEMGACAEALTNVLSRLPHQGNHSQKVVMHDLAKQLQVILRHMKTHPNATSDAKSIEKLRSAYSAAAEKLLGSKGKKEYKKHELPAVRGSHFPSKLSHEIHLSSGRVATETIRSLDTSLCGQLLKALGGHEEEVKYAESLHREGGAAGIRPTTLKKGAKYQGVPINARQHTVEVNGERRTVLRHGAHTVHGGPNRKDLQSKLKSYSNTQIGILLVHKKNLTLRLAELDAKGGDTKSLKAEIETLKIAIHAKYALQKRSDLVLAQTMPVVQAAIEEMANDPAALAIALKTGTFFIAEQSFLSHAQDDEFDMICDMRDAYADLSANAEIQFAADGPRVEVKRGEIFRDTKEGGVEVVKTRTLVITLPLPKKAECKLALAARPEKADGQVEPLRVTAALYTQGINIGESLGEAGIIGSEDSATTAAEIDQSAVIAITTQAAGIAEAAESLIEAGVLTAEEVMDLKEALNAVNQHYAPENDRGSKDVKGPALLDNLVKAMHGVSSKCCKSGKDRTAMGVNRQLAGNDPELRAGLDQGGSFFMTGQTQGLESGYAFGDSGYATMPRDMRPNQMLCGRGIGLVEDTIAPSAGSGSGSGEGHGVLAAPSVALADTHSLFVE